MFAASESNSVKVKVKPEASVISVVAWQINFFGFPSILNTILPYGQPVGVQVDVKGKSGVGVAGGKLTIRMDNSRTLGPYDLNEAGNAFVWLYKLDAKGLSVGDHTFVVTYEGDNSFRRVTADPVKITVGLDGVIQTAAATLQGSLEDNILTV